ncbi:MAG: erythromycin esterase family protein, partial [Thermoanaerobaculia bacterium]
SLAGLFADRWWSSEIFYDEALRSFLVAAHALDRQRQGSLRFAGFDLKQPDLAAAEIVATVARTDPARAATIRSLADRILALGGFGVFPNVAGFSATLELALPPPDAGATVALVVPLAGTGGSYGEAGVVVSPTGGDWSTRRVQSLPVTMLRNEATLLPLPIPEGPGTIELTLFHRGDGEVRFGWPRPVASDGAATPESWEHLAPAPLAMPLLQKQDYRHRFEHRDDGSSELVVAPDPAVAAARADLARIGQLLASPGAARLADAERRTVERAFRSLSQALAWRTLEEPNRDRLLADNVLALAAEAGPARRLLLLGHASHIERIENRMGGWLSSALGERYGSVTLAAAAGSYKYFGDPRTTPAGAPLVDFPLPADPWFDWIPREVTAPFVLDTARARRCAGDALNRAGVRPERTDLLVVLPRLRPIESARTGAP